VGIFVDQGFSQRHCKWAAEGWRARLSRGFSSTPASEVCNFNSGGKIIAMVQTAEPWNGYDSALRIGTLLDFTTGRSSLRQSKMSSILVTCQPKDVYVAGYGEAPLTPYPTT